MDEMEVEGRERLKGWKVDELEVEEREVVGQEAEGWETLVGNGGAEGDDGTGVNVSARA